MRRGLPEVFLDSEDARYMTIALREAARAAAHGEVPVGCVIVKEGKVIAAAHNLRERKNDPTAHAEILCLRKAGRRLGDWRLSDCTMYVTLEPCAMCASAIALARVKRLVFGASDPKAGAVVSVCRVLDGEYWNHKVEYESGVLAAESSQLLEKFFSQLRWQR